MFTKFFFLLQRCFSFVKWMLFFPWKGAFLKCFYLPEPTMIPVYMKSIKCLLREMCKLKDLHKIELLAHLVYQPKCLIQSWFVWCSWHRQQHCWHRHLCLCTLPPATVLDLETLYLVDICTSNIL